MSIFGISSNKNTVSVFVKIISFSLFAIVIGITSVFVTKNNFDSRQHAQEISAYPTTPKKNYDACRTNQECESGYCGKDRDNTFACLPAPLSQNTCTPDGQARVLNKSCCSYTPLGKYTCGYVEPSYQCHCNGHLGVASGNAGQTVIGKDNLCYTCNAHADGSCDFDAGGKACTNNDFITLNSCTDMCREDFCGCDSRCRNSVAVRNNTCGGHEGDNTKSTCEYLTTQSACNADKNCSFSTGTCASKTPAQIAAGYQAAIDQNNLLKACGGNPQLEMCRRLDGINLNSPAVQDCLKKVAYSPAGTFTLNDSACRSLLNPVLPNNYVGSCFGVTSGLLCNAHPYCNWIGGNCETKVINRNGSDLDCSSQPESCSTMSITNNGSIDPAMAQLIFDFQNVEKTHNIHIGINELSNLSPQILKDLTYVLNLISHTGLLDASYYRNPLTFNFFEKKDTYGFGGYSYLEPVGIVNVANVGSYNSNFSLVHELTHNHNFQALPKKYCAGEDCTLLEGFINSLAKDDPSLTLLQYSNLADGQYDTNHDEVDVEMLANSGANYFFQPEAFVTKYPCTYLLFSDPQGPYRGVETQGANSSQGVQQITNTGDSRRADAQRRCDEK